ncbi:MAG: hypothetical protein C0508_31495, partial [Cyanobacteria bacterium PR.023]|nr:hypothetical protein [Cyanobacteria bacterium PR.023]
SGLLEDWQQKGLLEGLPPSVGELSVALYVAYEHSRQAWKSLHEVLLPCFQPEESLCRLAAV